MSLADQFCELLQGCIEITDDDLTGLGKHQVHRMAEVLDEVAMAVIGNAVPNIQRTEQSPNPVMQRFRIGEIADHRLAESNRESDLEGGAGIDFGTTKRIEVGQHCIGLFQHGDVGPVDVGYSQCRLIDGVQRLEAGLQTQGFVRFCAFRSVWMKDIRTGKVDSLHEADGE